jgi:carboxymethylenebutenolidase
MLEGLSAAAPYYGGGITSEAETARQAKVPVMAHFAEEDKWIPMDSVQSFKAAHPEVQVFTYAAHHGFNCNHRGTWQAESAQLAKERTLAFFKLHLS